MSIFFQNQHNKKFVSIIGNLYSFVDDQEVVIIK